jgi:hypothetical protein
MKKPEDWTLGQITDAIEAADAAKADVLAKLAVLKTEVARIEGMSDDRFLLLEDRVRTLENGKQPPPKAEYGTDRYEWEGLMLVHQTPEKAIAAMSDFSILAAQAEKIIRFAPFLMEVWQERYGPKL